MILKAPAAHLSAGAFNHEGDDMSDDCCCKGTMTPDMLLARALKLWCEEKGVDPEKFRAAIFATMQPIKIQGTETR